jgi:hypothetical protein
MRRVTRRRFLAGSVLGALAALPATRGLLLVADTVWPAPLDERIARLFSDRESARRIGVAYLAAYPGEASRSHLIERLGAVDRAGGGSPSGDELRRRIDEARRADFAAGRIVRVDGWVLAETEARCCALVARA